MTDEETPSSEPVVPADEPHRDDGLDLAKALTRATAGSTPKQRARYRNKDRSSPRSRVSGAHPDDRDPQLLESTVSRLVDDHGWELDLRMRGVFARWPELVGEEVAAHCTPETFTEGGSWCAPTRPPGQPSSGSSRRPSYAASTRSWATTRSP